MTEQTQWVRIEGYKDQIANYEFGIEKVEYDGETLTVSLLNSRKQDYAIMEDCEYKLYVGGELVDETTGSPFGYDQHQTELSGKAKPGEEWRYEFYSPFWHDDAVNIDNWDGYLNFEGEIPKAKVDIAEVWSDKNLPEKGEDWKVFAKVGNSSGFKVKDINVSLIITGMDKMHEGNMSVDIGEGETKTLELTSGEIRKMLGVNELGIGGYSVCFEV